MAKRENGGAVGSGRTGITASIFLNLKRFFRQTTGILQPFSLSAQ